MVKKSQAIPLNLGSIIKIFLLLSFITGVVLIWLFFGSIHPCGILQTQIRKDFDTLDGRVMEELSQNLTPSECIGYLITRITDGPGAVQRKMFRSIQW